MATTVYSELKTLTELAKTQTVLPSRPSPSTIHRWYLKGVLDRDGNRVHLRVCLLGRQRVYSCEAWLIEFLEALDTGTVREEHKPKRRRGRPAAHSLADAERRLEQAGA